MQKLTRRIRYFDKHRALPRAARQPVEPSEAKVILEVADWYFRHLRQVDRGPLDSDPLPGQVLVWSGGALLGGSYRENSHARVLHRVYVARRERTIHRIYHRHGVLDYLEVFTDHQTSAYLMRCYHVDSLHPENSFAQVLQAQG